MTADVMVADFIVWAMTNAGWLVAVGGALLLGLALSPMRPARQDEGDRPTQEDMAGLIWRADWERTQREAAEARLNNVTAGLQRVFDQDTLIRLDAETDWEIRP